MSMSSFRTNILESIPSGLGMFGFPFSAIFAIGYRAVCMVSPCSSPSDPFYNIVNLADVADVFVANSA